MCQHKRKRKVSRCVLWLRKKCESCAMSRVGETTVWRGRASLCLVRMFGSFAPCFRVFKTCLFTAFETGANIIADWCWLNRSFGQLLAPPLTCHPTISPLFPSVTRRPTMTLPYAAKKERLVCCFTSHCSFWAELLFRYFANPASGH